MAWTFAKDVVIMIIKIISKLSDIWATPAEYRQMTDETILELIGEDILAVIEEEKIEIIREKGEEYADNS